MWLYIVRHVRGWDTMAAINQKTFSNAISLMKMYDFLLRFHWSLFLRVQLTIFQHWFRQWLGASQTTSHCLNLWWLVYWCIYASLSCNELTHWVNSLRPSVVKWHHRSWSSLAQETWSPDPLEHAGMEFKLSFPGQNGHHFPDDIFRCIFVDEKFCIAIQISLKCVLEGLIDNDPALV